MSSNLPAGAAYDRSAPYNEPDKHPGHAMMEGIKDLLNFHLSELEITVVYLPDEENMFSPDEQYEGKVVVYSSITGHELFELEWSDEGIFNIPDEYVKDEEFFANIVTVEDVEKLCKELVKVLPELNAGGWIDCEEFLITGWIAGDDISDYNHKMTISIKYIEANVT
jgi:hypothetical protein